jgi:hypothetical protein
MVEDAGAPEEGRQAEAYSSLKGIKGGKGSGKDKWPKAGRVKSEE